MIYVIVASGGEYDDFWTNNICASTDKEKAEAQLSVLQENLNRAQKILEKARVYQAIWFQQNPPPVLEQLIMLKNFPGKKNRTPEQAKEWQTNEDANFKKGERNHKKQKEWHDQLHFEQTAFLAAQGVPPEEQQKFHDQYERVSGFDLEEVEEL